MLLAPKLVVKACFSSLVRTIDTRFNDLDGRDTIQTSISVPTNDGAQKVCNAIGAGTTKALAEASATNKLNQTLGQITSALVNALTAYDQARPAIRALSPLAPLFSC